MIFKARFSINDHWMMAFILTYFDLFQPIWFMLEGGRLPDRGPDFERVGCQDWDVISEVATPCRKRPEVLKLGELDDDELF